MATTTPQTSSPAFLWLLAAAFLLLAAAVWASATIPGLRFGLPPILGLGAVWLLYGGITRAAYRLDDSGIRFWTLRGSETWRWADISQAYLDSSDADSSLALYSGSRLLRLGRADFRDIDDVARFIKAHVPVGALRRGKPAGK